MSESPPPQVSAGNGVDPDVYARRNQILAVLVLSLVIVVMGNASLNVALPSMARALEATQSQLQWLVDAYALVFAGLLLPFGALGDRFGRKGALQVGLVLFALGATAASLMESAWPVIGARAFMGVGAALVMPSTLSLLSSAFPARERPRAIAIWAGFAGAGAGIGVITSGFLLLEFTWHAVFLVNLPIVAIALLVGAKILPKSRDNSRTPLDPVGAVLSVVGLGSLLFAIIEGPVVGWTSPRVVVAFVVGSVAVTSFVAWERRTTHPMLDLTWFRDRRFSTGSLTISLAFFANFGLFFIMTQFLQFVLGYTPLEAGFATLPMSVMMVVSGTRSAGIVERFGPRRTIATGLAGAAVAFVLLALVMGPGMSYWPLLGPLLLFGTSVGMVMPPATGQIMSALPVDRAGVGSAVNDTTREVGGALGVAVLGSIANVVYRTGLGDLADGAPEQVRAAVVSSVAAAQEFAQSPAAPPGAADLVRDAFTGAGMATFLAAAAVTLVNAGLVLTFVPRRSSFQAMGEAEPVDEPATSPVSG
ncbi:MFS transporter [Salsipaludibacter albus]|uniref:MFS transporter n=1 Tax=Salsipaludibacter albus TaxID=2849650 RepID=UPI001EE4C272|nr:MFS transporter [Salsipaludibacter albus]MBY5164387.1 MFS transporter [Salsipaludibacter albus]